MSGRELTMSYLERIYESYRKASRAEKGRILDGICEVCGISRKYAIRKLSGPPPERSERRKRISKRRYGPEVIGIVKEVWRVAGYPWSARFKEILRVWKPWILKTSLYHQPLHH